MKWFKVLGIALLCLSLCQLVHAVSTDDCFDTDASIMLHMEGVDDAQVFTDSANCIGCPATWTAVNQAKTEDDWAAFGTTSARFDGTNDAITTPQDAIFGLAGAFTIDFDIYTNPSGDDMLLEIGDSTDDGLGIKIGAAGLVWVVHHGDVYAPCTGETDMGDNAKHHIAITKDGSNDVRIFQDGECCNSGAAGCGSNTMADAIVCDANGVHIGLNHTDGEDYGAGYIDELRVIDGTAVWVADFTSPVGVYKACAATDDGTIHPGQTCGGYITI